MAWNEDMCRKFQNVKWRVVRDFNLQGRSVCRAPRSYAFSISPRDADKLVIEV